MIVFILAEIVLKTSAHEYYAIHQYVVTISANLMSQSQFQLQESIFH